MGRREDIQAQIDQLQAELEGGGGDLELWVKDDKGRETRLTGDHAKRWLRQLGLDDDDGGGQGGEPDPSGDPAGGPGTDPPPRDSVWGRAGRGTPAGRGVPAGAPGRK